MTPSELKRKVEATGSVFFTRKTMRFFGDTMRNYSVRGPVQIETWSGTATVYALDRKRPVKNGLSSTAYFDSETFKRCFAKQ